MLDPTCASCGCKPNNSRHDSHGWIGLLLLCIFLSTIVEQSHSIIVYHKRLHRFDFEFDPRCPFLQQTVPLSDAVGTMNRLRHKREIVNILVECDAILFFLETSKMAIVIFSTTLGEGVQQTYKSIAMFPITNGMLRLR